MPLAKRTYDFPFVGGARQDIDARVLPFGALKRVENRRYTKDGRLARRFGYSAITFTGTDGSTLTDTHVRLASLGDEKVIIGKANVYSQLPSTPSDRWADRGYHPRAGHVTRKQVARKTGWDMQYTGVAYNAGYRLYCWIEAESTSAILGDLWVALVDDTTGGVVFIEKLQTGNASQAKVLAVSTYLHVFWVDESGGAPYDVKAKTFDTADTTPTAMGTATTLCTDLAAGAQYDVDVMPAANTVYFAYHQNAGSQRVEQRSSTLTLNANNTTTDAATNGVMSVLCNTLGSTSVFVSYSTATPATRYASFNASLAARNGPFDLDAAYGAAGVGGLICAGIKDANTAVFFYSNPNTVGGIAYRRTIIQTGTSLGVVSAAGSFYHVFTASKPFTSDSRLYCIFRTSSNEEFQSLFALCDCRVDVVGNGVAHIPQPEAFFGIGEPSISIAQLSAVAVREDGSHIFAGESVYETTGGSGITFEELRSVAVFAWDFADERRFLPVKAREALGWSGGLPTQFDGMSAAEMGFAYHPEENMCSAADSASAGNLINGGVYTYYFVYEWYDAKGQRHLSRPGPIDGLEHTIGGAATAIDLRIQTLTLTNKWRQNAGPAGVDEGSKVRILIYRNDNAGSVWHLVKSSALEPPNNSTTTHSVTFTDTLSFATIQTNEPLYVTDGSLPNDLPGSLKQIVSHRDRLFGCSGDVLYWTKKITPNGRAVEWSQLFALKVRPGVDISALASFESALVVFTEDEIYLLGGDGPEDDASGQQYAQPELHPSDVGCIEPRSLTLTREGLVFQSKRGIEMLPRGFGPSIPFGDAVADDAATYPTITSALVVPDQTQVRLAANDSSTDHAQLCWDYSLPNGGGWSVYTFSSLDWLNVSAVIWDDKYTFTTGSAIYQESTSWADNGTWINAVVESGDIRLSGLNGFGRIYETLIIGEHRGAHNLRIEVSYDGGDTWTGPYTWSYPAPAAGTEIGVMHVNRKQRTNSMRLRISDASGGTVNSEGAVLNGVSLVWGQAPGTRRVQTSLRK